MAQRFSDVRNTLSSSVDTTVTPFSDLAPCPLTSADPLDLLATVTSFHGQAHFSLPSTDDGSLDILAAAALIAGVCTETSDSVATFPSVPATVEARCVKRKREDGDEAVPATDEVRGVKRKREDEDETVSLDEDLYLSESDTDDDESDGDDADCEDDSDDDDFSNSSFRTAYDGCFADETIGEESFKIFQFDYDSDEDDESDSTDTASDCSESDSGEDSDPEDDDDDDDIDCPASCVCRTGRYLQLPPIARRCKVVSPLYKKLMKRRLLRFANQSRFVCCRERRCSLRWRKMPKYKVMSDYEPTDLRVYHFRWGTWKPEDEYDDIFW